MHSGYGGHTEGPDDTTFQFRWVCQCGEKSDWDYGDAEGAVDALDRHIAEAEFGKTQVRSSRLEEYTGGDEGW